MPFGASELCRPAAARWRPLHVFSAGTRQLVRHPRVPPRRGGLCVQGSEQFSGLLVSVALVFMGLPRRQAGHSEEALRWVKRSRRDA